MIVIDYAFYLDNKKNELFWQVNFKISFYRVFLNIIEKINNSHHNINNVILFSSFIKNICSWNIIFPFKFMSKRKNNDFLIFF